MSGLNLGNVIHGQSDNLTAIALVDAASGLLPTDCAVRWSFRYAAGIPANGATLYRRAVIQPATLNIPFDTPQSSPDWITLGDAKVRAVGGSTVIAAGSGLQVPTAFLVSFAFPVVSAAIVGAGDGAQQINVAAYHYPYVVDQLDAAQPVGNASTQPVTGDIIDYLLVTVSAPMTVQALDVIPLRNEVAGGSWQKVADASLLATAADFTNGAVPPTPPPTATGSLTDACQSLFDPSVTTGPSAVVPMGERQIQTTGPTDPDDPDVQMPTLEFLRLAATLPATARLLGLMIDVNAPQANQPNAWDYLIVGHWAPRPNLVGGRRVNLSGSAAGAEIAIVQGLLLESAEVLRFTAAGLTLGPAAVWIHFTAPGDGSPSGARPTVVELELGNSGGDGVQVSAFSEERVVDWTLGTDGLRLTVCADSIDAICVAGNDTVIRAITWDIRDNALADSASARLGDVCYWMFSARDHPVPSPPTGVTVGQLEGLFSYVSTYSASDDPTQLAVGIPTYRANNPKHLTVGIRWDATPPLTDLMMFYAASYQVLGGANQQSAQIIAGKPNPLVVPPPPLPPDNVFDNSLTPNSGPWYVLDEVFPTPAQRVYGVTAVDLFGRASQTNYAGPLELARTTGPEPPTNVQATLRQDGTILVTWAWDGTDPYLTGFNVYYRAGSATTRTVEGTVVTVGPIAHATFGLSAQIDTSHIHPTSLARTLLRIGEDHYVVKHASATNVQVVPTGGGAPTSEPGLSMTMHVNPSTPQQVPNIGDQVVVVYETLAQPGQPLAGSSYDGHVEAPGASAAISATSDAGQPVVTLATTAGFTAGQYVVLSLGSSDQEVGVIQSIRANKSITLEGDLANEHVVGELVVQLPAVQAPMSGTAASGQPAVPVGTTAGFIAGQYLTVNLGGADQEAGVVSAIQADTSLSLTACTDPIGDWNPGGLINAHSAGELITQFQAVLNPVPAGQSGVAWPPADTNGIQTISVGVAAYNDSQIESTICGPVTVKQIPTAAGLAPPPVPQQTVAEMAFTDPPDAYGQCSYTYQPNCTAGARYHVYRALDATLLAVDSGFRDSNGIRDNNVPTAAGYNPDGSPKDPSPLQAVDFEAVTGPLPDVSALTPTNWSALANLLGNETAFQRITDTALSASGDTLTYVDQGLPVGSDSKYLYRLRAVTVSSDQGSFGWASSPVQLWPQAPSRPTVSRFDVSGNLLTVRWNPAPEPEVTGYEVYLATDERSAQDIRGMALAATVTGTTVADELSVPTSAVLHIPQGQRYWFAVVAVADYTAIATATPNPGKFVSGASDAIPVFPQTVTAPTPPSVGDVTITGTGGKVQLAFKSDPNPTVTYMLLRRPAGSKAGGTAVTTWQTPASAALVTLTDAAPLATSVDYLISCSNESRRIAISDPIAYAPGGARN